MKKKKAVNSKLYSEEYYIKDNEGGSIFFETNGKKTSYRFNKFLKVGKVRRDQRVLDIGCGRGEIIIQSAMRGAQGIGIDYSADSINICNKIKNNFPKELRDRIKFKRMDIKKLDFPPDYFDRVFMLDVIEHLHDWEIKIALEQIYKSMKKNAIMIIHTTPNTDFYKYGYPVIRAVYPILRTILPPVRKLIDTKPNWKNKKFLPKDPEEGQVYNKEGHVNEQNPKRLKRILKKWGFETKIMLVPFTRDVNSFLLKIVYGVLSLPLIKNIFCAEIIAVSKK